MLQAKLCRKFFSLLVGVAALGLFYAGEAFAVCCKNNTTGACGCSLATTCTLGTTKVTSCTLSGGALTLNGSVISCLYGPSQGNISTIRGDVVTGIPAEYTEYSNNVTCDEFPDTNNDGIPDNTTPNEPGQFELTATYVMKGECVEDPDSGIGNNCIKFTDFQNKKHGGSGSTNVSQAVCNNASGELRYQAFCGAGVTVTGFLRYIGTEAPPLWAQNLDCTAGGCQMRLGGFRTDRKGNIDLAACDFDFPDQTAAGGTLTTRGVLLYKEQYQPNTLCTGSLGAADGQRRMCQNHSFDPNSTNGPCAAVKEGGVLLTFKGGINPQDETTVDTVLLDVDQWRPSSTQSLGCKVDDPNLNSGNVPTTILDSATFNTSTINAPGSVKAFVKGFPDDTSPAQRVADVSEGLKIDFDGCRGLLKDGMSQVICRHPEAWTPDGFVELGITGTTTVNGKTLQFVGFTSKVKLSGSCTPGTF